MVKWITSQSVRTDPDDYTSDYGNVPFAQWVKKKKGKEEKKPQRVQFDEDQRRCDTVDDFQSGYSSTDLEGSCSESSVTDIKEKKKHNPIGEQVLKETIMEYMAGAVRRRTKTIRNKIFEEYDVNISTKGFTMGRFDMLPFDVVLDILSRLPTESVLECKLVCQNWIHLVRDPSFSRKHLEYHLDSGKLSFLLFSNHPDFKEFIYTEYDESCHATPFNKEIKMDLKFPFEKYRFVGACNGLICFQAGTNQNPDTPVFICNPFTREYVILPEFEDLNDWTGFGYSPSTNEYKVVRAHASNRGGMGIVHVYTLGSGNGWRNVGILDLHLEKGIGVFANGALYWLHRSENAVVVSFGLTDERFAECRLPERAPRDFFLLWALDDILRVTYYNGIRECEIWSLKKNRGNYNLSWSKEFHVVGTCIPRPFGITKSGKLLYGVDEICSYDPKSSPAKKKLGFGKPMIYQVITFQKTFISLQVLEGKDTSIMEGTEDGPKLKKL